MEGACIIKAGILVPKGVENKEEYKRFMSQLKHVI